jgi:hypothetical protein
MGMNPTNPVNDHKHFYSHSLPKRARDDAPKVTKLSRERLSVSPKKKKFKATEKSPTHKIDIKIEKVAALKLR